MVFRQVFVFASVALGAVMVITGIFWPTVNWAWLIIGPLIALGIHDLVQNRHTLLRIYPVVGHFRYLFESFPGTKSLPAGQSAGEFWRTRMHQAL